MATTRNDFATQLLLFLLEKIPATLEPWGQAMLAELAVIDGFWTRLRWSLGGGMTLVTASIRLIIGSSGPEEDRRLDVSLIVGYQFLFSAMLMGVLTLQLPRITESWSYAVPALIVCYALSGLPAVLGLGLALRDEGARLGTIILSAVHALLEPNTSDVGLPHTWSLRLSVSRLTSRSSSCSTAVWYGGHSN